MTKTIIHHGILLDESVTYTLTELSEISSFEKAIIVEMTEYGILEPQGKTPEQWVFSSRSFIRFKKAMRLHQDLHINWAGVSLVLDLLEERESLHQKLALLEHHLNEDI